MRAILDQVDPITSRELGFTATAAIAGERGFDFAVAQVLIYVADVATAALLASEGIQPDIVAGHSMGEIPALVIGGAIDLALGAEIVCRRTRAIVEHGAPGGMLAVQADETRMHHLLTALAPIDVVVGAINGPDQVVCSGAIAELERLARVCGAAGFKSTRVEVDFPAHHPCLAPVAAAFERSLLDRSSRDPLVPVFSAIRLRDWMGTASLGTELSRQLIDPVRFGDAIRHLYARGVRQFVECGGGKALTSLVRRALGPTPDVQTLVPLREGGESAGIAAAAAQLRGSGGGVKEWARGKSVEEIAGAIQLLADALRAAPGDSSPAKAAPVKPSFTTSPPPRATSPSPVVPSPSRPNGAAASASRAAAPAMATTHPSGPIPSHDEIAGRVREVFARATEYPLEVLDLDADLESDLGIDSLKQVDLMALVQQEFALPPMPDLRLREYQTLRKVVGLVSAGLGA